MNILVLYAAIALALVAFATRWLAWCYHVRQIRRRRERRGGYLPVFDQEWVPSSGVLSERAGTTADARHDALSLSSLDQDWTPKR